MYSFLKIVYMNFCKKKNNENYLLKSAAISKTVLKS